VIDWIVQLGLKGAYRLMQAYWAVRRPSTHGALVAVWHDGRVLLVRNSYHRYYAFPGGYVRWSETSRQAAARELAEEVGIRVEPEQLELGLDVVHEWEHHPDRVEIWELEVDRPPRTEVDNREVIAAELYAIDRALSLELFPPVRWYLEKHRRFDPSHVRSAHPSPSVAR
jgi:ADP-ribose pyrophosphatase YjhB (NUDIX family)